LAERTQLQRGSTFFAANECKNGTHILFDAELAGQQRRLLTHSARNGFLYTMDRHNGQIIGAKPYMDNVNWTKGIDQKTGKPLDYDPGKDVQTYVGVGNLVPGAPLKKLCPSHLGTTRRLFLNTRHPNDTATQRRQR
jgi:glucose dehydrogenase